MTEHTFKSGIKVSIPEYMTKEQAIQEWAAVAGYMALLINPPPKPPARKPYTYQNVTTALARRRKRSWRSPKKLAKPRI